MKEKEPLSSSITVKEVLDQYPASMQVFLEIGLFCVGCPAESFHTLADVAKENKIDLRDLIKRITDAIQKEKMKSGSDTPKKIRRDKKK